MNMEQFRWGVLAVVGVFLLWVAVMFYRSFARRAHAPAPDMSVAVPVAAPPLVQKIPQREWQTSSSNYFVKHWRGELSLGISYWVNCFLVSIVKIILIVFTSNFPLPYRTLYLAIALLAFLPIDIWMLVGLWRSSNRHEARGGSPIWAAFAKLVIFQAGFGFIMLLYIFGSILIEVLSH